MRRRSLYVIGLATLVGATVMTTAPAFAAPRVPTASMTWSFGPTAPFDATRFDGEYVAPLNRVYFLGFRTDADATDGSVWYLDVATSTYVDTGVDMPVPVSNYAISALTDLTGHLGLYIFGGRDATAAIVNTVQVYYPQSNTAQVVASDPWPGTTPSACISLPAMGVATLANHAIVMGGLSFAANGCADDNSAQTWVFNPKGAPGSKWIAGPNLAVARGYITPAVLNGRVYAIGGDVNVAGTLNAKTTVETWKPPSGGWSHLVAQLPEPCDESQAFPFTAGPLMGDIALASCGQWPNGTGDTNIYDSVANTWTLGGAILDTVRNEAGATFSIGGIPRAYILGGYTASSNFINPTNESELGKPGANSSGDRPNTLAKGSSRATTS